MEQQEALYLLGTLLQTYANQAKRKADDEALDNIEGTMDNLEALILEHDPVLHASLKMGKMNAKEGLTQTKSGDILSVDG